MVADGSDGRAVPDVVPLPRGLSTVLQVPSMSEPSWQRYLTDYNEGLGLVYERFVLNDFLLMLRQRYGIA